MDYKAAIGQKVKRTYDGAEGILESIDKLGVIHIKFAGEHSGGYLFDPFIREYAVFVDLDWQQRVDDEIKRIDEEQIALINRRKAVNKSEETYFITLKNEDGSNEEILSLSCTEAEAREAFSYVVKEQQRRMRKVGDGFKWRQVSLFETESGRKIAQES